LRNFRILVYTTLLSLLAGKSIFSRIILAQRK